MTERFTSRAVAASVAVLTRLCSQLRMLSPLLAALLLSSLSPASTAPWISDYISFLPANVQNFVNETLTGGEEVVDQLYDDVKEELLDKTAHHVDSFTDVLSDMMEKYHEFGESVDSISK